MRYVVAALIVLAVLINGPLILRILAPSSSTTEYDDLVNQFFHYGDSLAYDKQFAMFTKERQESYKTLEAFAQKSMRAMKHLRLETNGGRFEIQKIEINRELDEEVELTVHAVRGNFREPYLFLLKWQDGGWKIDQITMMKVVDFTKFIQPSGDESAMPMVETPLPADEPETPAADAA